MELIEYFIRLDQQPLLILLYHLQVLIHRFVEVPRVLLLEAINNLIAFLFDFEIFEVAG